jgi:5,5'-dehydrodivanillate O-demethylase
MAITQEENERLTRYGPGTPCGELFRRYWWPIGVITELTADAPTRHARILGEDLVLWKDKSGNVGLIQDHCAHRGASLLYGRVEERGISCAYHGWLYDTAGNCLECPAEPEGSKFHLTVKARAYPVREHLGLYWAYLGPAPAPLLPNCGLAPGWGVVAVEVEPGMRCNWLQIVENSADGLHFPILHQEFSAHRWPNPPEEISTTRGYIDLYAANEYWEEPWGIMRQATYKVETFADLTVGDGDAIIFPHIRRHRHEVIVKVPVDDTTTTKIRIYPTTQPEPDRPIEHWINESSVEVRNGPGGRNRMDSVNFQDLTIMESQGPISERENWRLATSDKGIVMLHAMLFREMEKVARGLDPIGVIREPRDATVETFTPALWEPDGRVHRGGMRLSAREAATTAPQ